MRRLLLIIALLISQAAWAGDFEDGVAAYEQSDYTTALTKFQSAAKRGNSDAQYNLGLMYDKGEGVAKDYKEAVRWYTLAAKQGIAIAQY